MGLKIVVGGGVLDAPDWYKNYRTFAIYCAVGRPALWPPESWNIAYILGSAQGITLQSAARTARKQRSVPSVASRHLPAPRGVTLKGAPKYTADYQPKFVMAFTTKLSERSRPFPTERFIVGSQQ